MEELSRAERYLFILAVFLIVLAYSAGGVNIIKAAGPQLTALDYAATGRTPSGSFAAYPGNAPA